MRGGQLYALEIWIWLLRLAATFFVLSKQRILPLWQFLMSPGSGCGSSDLVGSNAVNRRFDCTGQVIPNEIHQHRFSLSMPGGKTFPLTMVL